MSETGQIILGIGILIIVYILTRKFHIWRMKRTYLFILQDLKDKGAVDPASAVTLPYASQGLFQLGRRDYRPKALQFMVANNIVGRTESGFYYLIDRKAGNFNPG